MKKITAKDFDRAFDEGEDVSEYLDLSKVRRASEELKRVNIDFPVWIIAALDREANRLGVSRQALVKIWIAERLEGKESEMKTEVKAA